MEIFDNIEEKIEEAQEGLLSAKSEWYELVKKHQRELADNAVAVADEIAEKIKEIQSDISLSQEEK
jgi:hypothetical protein